MTGKKSMTLEQLLWWTYHTQRADVVINHGVGLFEGEMMAEGITPVRSSPDGVHLLSTTGLRVDSMGRARGDLHPDAERVHRTVLALQKFEQAVVMTCIRIGGPPDQMLGAVPRYRPMRDRAGRPVVMRDRRGKRLASAVELVPDPGHIAMCRRAWVEWREVMSALMARLTSTPLEAHVLSGLGWGLTAPEKLDIPTEGSNCVSTMACG